MHFIVKLRGAMCSLETALLLESAGGHVRVQVMLSTNDSGQRFIKVRVRTICIPQVRRSRAVGNIENSVRVLLGLGRWRVFQAGRIV